MSVFMDSQTKKWYQFKNRKFLVLGLVSVVVVLSLIFYTSVKSQNVQNTNKNNSTQVTSNSNNSVQNQIVDEADVATPAQYIQKTLITTATAKVLPVPYFNQCLQADLKTFFPDTLEVNNRPACKDMCSAAVMVMAGGYFKKLDYDTDNPQSLKKYMYSDSGQGISDTCGLNQGGAFGEIATETDNQLGISSCDGGGIAGMEKYAQTIGLYTKNITLGMTDIKKAIDRGDPVVIGTKPHIFLVKGYDGDKLIVNDPYNDSTKNQTDYSYDGFDASYSFPAILYFHTLQPFIYALEISDKPIDLSFKFKLGSKVKYKGVAGNTTTPLSVRSAPCDTTATVQKIPVGSQGVVVDQPKFLEFCPLSNDSKNWYKIKWSNGVVGWSLESYLSS